MAPEGRIRFENRGAPESHRALCAPARAQRRHGGCDRRQIERPLAQLLDGGDWAPAFQEQACSGTNLRRALRQTFSTVCCASGRSSSDFGVLSGSSDRQSRLSRRIYGG
jgi:hypothetical protein